MENGVFTRLLLRLCFVFLVILVPRGSALQNSNDLELDESGFLSVPSTAVTSSQEDDVKPVTISTSEPDGDVESSDIPEPAATEMTSSSDNDYGSTSTPSSTSSSTDKAPSTSSSTLPVTSNNNTMPSSTPSSMPTSSSATSTSSSLPTSTSTTSSAPPTSSANSMSPPPTGTGSVPSTSSRVPPVTSKTTEEPPSPQSTHHSSSVMPSSPPTQSLPPSTISVHVDPVHSNTPSTTSSASSPTVPFLSTSPQPVPSVVTTTGGVTASPVQSCSSCTKALGLSLGLSIPATAIVTFIATALLFMYCQKAKKASPYVRMAPTVYFDEEEQD